MSNINNYSSPLDRFNHEVEYGKYVFLSVKQVMERKEEIDKSIRGEYDNVRNDLGAHQLRGSESLDLSWIGSTSSNDVLIETVWYSVRSAIINTKVCCDGYARGMEGDLKKFYEEIEKVCPSIMIILPNGKRVSPFVVLQLARHCLAHDEDLKGEAERKRLGMEDIRSFLLTPIRLLDDGKDIRLLSYDVKSQVIQGYIVTREVIMPYENLTDCLYTFLIQECERAIRMYDAIKNGQFKDETECVQENYWRPTKFV